MDADKKRQIKEEYINKQVVGAIYAIECSGNNRRIIKSTKNISGIKNRFQFSMLTKTCPDPSLSGEYAKYGSDSFSLVILEELKMGEGQTPKEFSDDIKLLCELWIEKLDNEKK